MSERAVAATGELDFDERRKVLHHLRLNSLYSTCLQHRMIDVVVVVEMWLFSRSFAYQVECDSDELHQRLENIKSDERLHEFQVAKLQDFEAHRPQLPISTRRPVSRIWGVHALTCCYAIQDAKTV